MLRRPSRGDGHRSVVVLSIALVFALLALGCPNGSEPDADLGTPSGSSGSTIGGSGGTPTATCGNGAVEAGETCDDGNTTPGDGCSASCQAEPPPPATGAAAVVGVQATASHIEGPTLTLPSYTVPEDGLLLVRVGAHARVSDSVTFGGEEMIHVYSAEVTYATTISVEMFYLPVTAGRSGAIVVDYANPGTDQKGLVVATLVGVDTLEEVQPSNGGGPNLAEDTISTTRNDSLVLSAFTAFGDGIPEEVGVGHVLDAYPTVPETDFHEMKLQTGHVDAATPGSYTLGYQNTRATGYMDHAMIVAVFSDGS